MKKFYLLVILVLSTGYFTQAQDWVFAEQFESSGAVTPVDVKLDASGDIYVVGNFINELTVGALPTLPSDATGKEDIFLCKFSADGTPQWLKQIASDNKDLVGGLAIDPSDNIYLAGGFMGATLGFSGEVTTIPISVAGKHDAFIAKYNTSGALLDASGVFYGTNVQRLLDITYDFTKDLLVTVGQFQGEIKYDSTGEQTLTAINQKDHILARFDPNLNYIDKVIFTGSIKQSVLKNVNNCVIADTVNSYFATGDLVGDFLDASSTLLVSAPDVTSMDILILKTDDQLVYQWGRTGGGTAFDHINSSGADAFGNIYFTGKAQSATIVIDSTATLSSAPLASLGGQDYLIAKYNRSGNLQWFNREGGPGTDNAYGLSVRGQRLLYTGNIDNGGNVSSGFAVYDLNGKIIASDAITGDGEESGLNVIFDDSGDSTIVIGTFDGDSLKAGPFRLDNASLGVKDGFMVKYGYQFRVYEVTSTDILCNGANTGVIEVETEFGTPPITYEWTPNVSSTNTATDLLAGDYKIVASGSGGRKDSITITLTEPDDLATALETSTPTSCNVLATGGNKTDGAVDISVTGGNAAYTYLWSPGGQTTQDIPDVGAGDHIVTVTDANSCIEVDTFVVAEPSKVSHGGTVVDSIHVPLADGAVHLNTYGGTPGYSFSWTGPPGFIPSSDDTIKNLEYGGNYPLQVTDANSCVFDTTFNVPADTGLIIAILEGDYRHVSCKDDEDGYAKVTVTANGSGSYSYAWRTSGGTPVGTNNAELTNVAAGTFIAKVTDLISLSVTEASITILEPASFFTLGIDSTWNASCNGVCDGAIFISVTGGWGDNTFLWTPTGKVTKDIFDLCDGTYTVQVSDTGLNTGTCVKQLADIAITQPTEVTVDVSVENEISCFGSSDGSLTAAPAGGTAPYTYVWSDLGAQNTQTASNLTDGIYTCDVQDANGCPATDQRTLSQPDQLMIDSVSQDDIALTVTVYVSGGTSPYTYTISGETPVEQAGTSYTSPALTGGEYSVMVNDANMCGPVKDTVIALSINTFISGADVKLYPNPSNGQFTLELENEKGEDLVLEIMNLTGQMVYKKLYPYNGNPSFNETIDLGNQAKGVYLLRVNGLPVSNKLMIH